VEYDSHGLTHFDGIRLQAALGAYDLVDVSRLVPSLRAIKSTEELVYVREAARLSDLADAAAFAATAAGADEGEILAAMHSAIFSAGGDYPANEFIIGSGRDALLCRYKSGRRRLDAADQLTLEFAGVYRHYHAAIMRTHVVGAPRPQHLAYHSAAREALDACAAELRPGRTAGDVFAAHTRVLDAHGLGRQVHAVVDGCADVLRWQSVRHRAVPSVFPAHDPDGQRQRNRALPRAHLLDHRQPCGAAECRLSGPSDQIALAEF
jgi:Xaa-Pro dipeptidase